MNPFGPEYKGFERLFKALGYTWHFEVLLNYRQAFLRAAWVTAELTAGGFVIGVSLGLLLGLMRSQGGWAMRWIAGLYIEFFRSTPALVQLVWIYYALPILLGAQIASVPSVILGLGLHSAAYFAEIFRGGIASIHRGQADAAAAIGMRPSQAMRRIILPQAARRMLPPFINEVANLIKLTTLGSVIAVAELLHEGENLISETFRPLEIYTALALAFALIIFPIILLSQRLEAGLKARS
jgi:polar amino acid transport system permease protein